MNIEMHPNLVRERLFENLVGHKAFRQTYVADVHDLIDKVIWQLRFIEMEEKQVAVEGLEQGSDKDV